MGEPRWRVGTKLGRTLYRDNVCVGMVDTPELAAEIVAAMNRPKCEMCGGEHDIAGHLPRTTDRKE